MHSAERRDARRPSSAGSRKGKNGKRRPAVVGATEEGGSGSSGGGGSKTPSSQGGSGKPRRRGGARKGSAAGSPAGGERGGRRHGAAVGGGSGAVAATAKAMLLALGGGAWSGVADMPEPVSTSNEKGAGGAAPSMAAKPGGSKSKKRKQKQEEEGEQGKEGSKGEGEESGKRNVLKKRLRAEGAGEGTVPAPAVPGGDVSRMSSKAQKRLKTLSHMSTKGEVLTPAKVSARPFDTDPTDHCETPFEAYRDIEPFLFRAAQALGKSKEELLIYDPYFCEGSMVAHLRKLGFPRVYNRNEDFYEAIRRGKTPRYDVLVTNPPFSADHMKRIVQFCVEQSKPFFLLMPNFVLKKTYYRELVEAAARKLAEPSFLAPNSGYKFWSPGRAKFCSRFVANTRGGVGDAVPFETIWYIGGHSPKDVAAMHKWWQKKYEGSAQLAAGEAQLPERVVPARVSGGEKRPNPRQRKALAKKRRAGGAPV
eukprot:jgi/Tetstr1/446726/TSEL_034214.t1